MTDPSDYDPEHAPADSDAPQWMVELILWVALFPGLFVVALWLVGADLSCNGHPDCSDMWFVSDGAGL